MAIPPWTPVTTHHPAIDPVALAAHAEGIRRLCRSLVSDAARADDMAQDTMRLAIERPPRPGWNLYAWLAGVARNLARGGLRAERRRLAREARAARPEGTASTLDTVSRLEERRLVVEAVLALAEPYRTAVALRWLDGLAPREIARRRGMPVETVRTHLRRGLDLLRAELDRRHGGDRRRWVGALLPLAIDVPGAGVAGVLGGILVGTQTKAVAVAAALVLAAGATWWVLRPDSEPATEATPGPSPAAVATKAAAAGLAARVPSPMPASATVPPSPGEIGGVVLSLDGRAIAAARVRVGPVHEVAEASEEGAVRTDSEGRFLVAIPADATVGRVSAWAAGYRPLAVEARGGTTVELRLTPAPIVHFLVRDGDTDAPIPGAVVESVVSSDATTWRESAVADAQGRAAIPDPGPGDLLGGFGARQARLVVRAAGYGARNQPLWEAHVRRPATATRPVEVYLRRADPIRVRVLDVDGTTPVAGARVRGFSGAGLPVAVGGGWRVLDSAFDSLGDTTTDAEGVAVLSPFPGDRLVLLAEANGRVGVTWPERFELRPRPQWTVVLRRVVRLRGRVVDDQGRAVAGARVEEVAPLAPSERAEPWPHLPPAIQDRITTFADAEGRFELRWLVLSPDGTPTKVWAGATGYGPGEVLVAAPPAEVEPSSVTLVLRPPSKPPDVWTVRVHDVEGRPIHGAVTGQPLTFPVATTAADGTARLGIVDRPGASPVVFARAPGYATVRTPVSLADPRRTLEFVLPPARSLLVRTIVAAGAPAPAEVRVCSPDAEGTPSGTAEMRFPYDPRVLASATTDADGWASFGDLPPGRLVVLASRWAAAGDEVRAEVGESVASVDVRMPRVAKAPGPRSVVEGDVVDAEGRPITQYSAMLLWDEGRRALPPVLEGRRFRFEDVAPGRYTVAVLPSGGVGIRAHETPVEVFAGTDVRGLRIRIGERAALEGTLRADDGSVVVQIQVTVLSRTTGQFCGGAVTGHSGTFVVENLWPGDYLLRASELRPRADGPPVRVVDGAFTLSAGERARRAFEVVPAARLWVRCDDARFASDVDAFRAPPGTPESARGEASRWSSVVVTDVTGAQVHRGLLLEGRHAVPTALAPGRHRVRVDAGKLGAFEGAVVVLGSEDAEVVVRLVQPAAR